jgi:hypothetical protein
MEDTKSYLEKLIRAVITFNSPEFKQLILDSDSPIYSFHDSENNNILHELCKLMTKEAKLIEYVKLLCDTVIPILAQREAHGFLHRSHESSAKRSDQAGRVHSSSFCSHRQSEITHQETYRNR